MLEWLRDNAVDELGLGGDFGDVESASTHGGNPRPPMWEEDTGAMKKALRALKAAALEGIQKESKATKLTPRELEMIFEEGNHCDRIARMLVSMVPTLSSALTIPEALGLAEMGIKWVPSKQQPIRRGSLDILHGDQMASRPGGELPKHHAQRAIELHGEKGRTVVYGHTHKPQMAVAPKGDGVMRAIGVGCGRTLRPKWLKRNAGWAHQFMVAYLPKGEPANVYTPDVHDGAFIWNGKRYSGRRRLAR